MSSTVFLGNLPVWVTADDIKSWLAAENLVADSVKVIRNPETQESKGFAFIEAPNADEMQSIIRRFDRAPLEDRLLRANPAQPPKAKAGPPQQGQAAPQGQFARPPQQQAVQQHPPASAAMIDRNRRGGKKHKRQGGSNASHSAFAEELAKAL
jgi:RNA recognition motif-containing protein